MAEEFYLGGIFIKQDDDSAELHSLYQNRETMKYMYDFLKRHFPNIRWIWSANHGTINLSYDDDMIVNLREQALINHRED